MVRPNKGFTLIELLVVVGVIGVLMGLLIAQLSKSRRSARAMVCASNLRGIAQWATTYSTRWDDVLPFHGGPPYGDTNGLYWAGSMSWSQAYADDSDFTNYSEKLQNASVTLRSLSYYNNAGGRIFKPLYCPETEGIRPWLDGQNMVSYGINSFMGGYKGPLGWPVPPALPSVGAWVPKSKLLTAAKYWFSDGYVSNYNNTDQYYTYLGPVWGPYRTPPTAISPGCYL